MEQLAPDLWVVAKPLKIAVGDIGCRMTVVRLADGGLWLHSPVELDAVTCDGLDALGPVRAIVAPNKVHSLLVGAAAAHYPQAQVYGAPGLPEKRPKLRFDGVLGDEAPPQWRGQIDQRVVLGLPVMNEVAFCHRASRTLILTDLAFNVARDRTAGARLFYWLTGAAGRFGPHGIVRLGVRDRTAARRSLDAVLAWDFDSVIVSHGDVLASGGREKLARGFAFLG